MLRFGTGLNGSALADRVREFLRLQLGPGKLGTTGSEEWRPCRVLNVARLADACRYPAVRLRDWWMASSFACVAAGVSRHVNG